MAQLASSPADPPDHPGPSPQDVYSMDNSGRGPLRVPGFGGIPLQYQLRPENRFAHAMMEWRQTPIPTELELDMVRAMNDLTDLPDWHLLSREALNRYWLNVVRPEYPLLTDRASKWCLRELRDKASGYNQTGFVRVLDTGSVVCKSDHLPNTLASNLAASTLTLFDSMIANRKGCPGEVAIVDPQMYPLVYGRTPVLHNGGSTSLENVYGRDTAAAEVAPSKIDELSYKSMYDRETALHQINWGRTGRKPWSDYEEQLTSNIDFDDSQPAYFFSPSFQCLPCDVDPNPGGGVRIVSYINNLHPKHSAIYGHIEKLISAAIEPWSACLVKGVPAVSCSVRRSHVRSGRVQCGRVPSRIASFGRAWVNDFPLMALAFDEKHKEYANYRLHNPHAPTPYAPIFQEVLQASPAPNAAAWAWAEEYLTRPDEHGVAGTMGESEDPLPENWKSRVWSLITQKARRRLNSMEWRSDCMLEPGMALSFEDWSAGRIAQPGMTPIFTARLSGQYKRRSQPQNAPAKHREGYHFHGPIIRRYDVHLQEQLQARGLQIITKIWSIELTPEHPYTFPHEEDWHLQGMLNEHVAATAVLAFDANNVSSCWISFRQETALPEPHDRWNYERVYRVETRTHPSIEYKAHGEFDAAQHIGRVELKIGRLVTFPNVMESRLDTISLTEPTRAGHIRFISLWLVDPHYRICSTRNTPAQQHEWWAEVVMDILQSTGLPTEICDMILLYCTDYPASDDQAERDRARLRGELELLEHARMATMKDDLRGWGRW